jgi:hypothetical protein
MAGDYIQHSNRTTLEAGGMAATTLTAAVTMANDLPVYLETCTIDCVMEALLITILKWAAAVGGRTTGIIV